MKNLAASALLTTASLFAFSVPALAQEAPSDTENATDEIVVTAQRRQERVVDVPISITVADQAQLERQQVNNLNDLNRIAPSLEIQSAPGQNTGGGGAIRGIGTQSFSPGAVASVGVVVDQVSQGNANIADLFDVARIEVLKGPQGTLFGLTTSAGVINITTNAPDPDAFSARFRTELSDAGTLGSKYGQQIVQGVVNIPISSNSALRVSALGNKRQGVNRNTFTGKLNDVDRYSVRGRFLWEPTDSFSVNIIGDWFKSEQNNSGDFFTFVRNDANVARLASCGITPGEGNQDFCIRTELSGQTEGYGGSFQIDYDAGPFVLTSISSVRRFNADNTGNNIYRADPLVSEILAGPESSSIRLVTQEFRMSSVNNGRLEYTIGAFYSRQESVQRPNRFSITLRPAPGVRIPIVNTPGARNDVADESLAVFGQATFHLTDAFRLIAGGRYSGARLSLDRFDLSTNARSRQLLNTSVVSYRFGAQYDFDQRTMVYATHSKGFKGGQIAIPAPPLLPFVVLPETPTSSEIGLKTTLFGGLVVDLNAFYQKVANFQAQQCSVNPVTTALSCVLTNIDGVKSKGAELNFFGRVSDQLSLNTGFIYTDATYPNGFIGSDGTNVGGTQLAYSPKYKFTLSGEFEQPITEGFDGFLAADTVWKSRLRYEANSRTETTFHSHWTVGGRIGVRTADERFTAALFARNLFNVNEPSLLQSNFAGTGVTAIGAIYGPQSFRQIGLSLDAKF